MRKRLNIALKSAVSGEEYTITRDELDKAVKDLAMHSGTSRKHSRRSGSCVSGVTCKKLVEDNTLHCRQLCAVAKEVRKAVLRHDWEVARVLITILSDRGIKLYDSTIIRTSLVILFSHPNTSMEVVKEFIRNVLNYTQDEEIHKFIKILFALRKEPLGAFIRRSKDYKIIYEPEHKDL